MREAGIGEARVENAEARYLPELDRNRRQSMRCGRAQLRIGGEVAGSGGRHEPCGAQLLVAAQTLARRAIETAACVVERECRGGQKVRADDAGLAKRKPRASRMIPR